MSGSAAPDSGMAREIASEQVAAAPGFTASGAASVTSPAPTRCAQPALARPGTRYNRRSPRCGQTSLCGRRVAWPAGARAPALRPPNAHQRAERRRAILCYARLDVNGCHHQFAAGLRCEEAVVAALGGVQSDCEVGRHGDGIKAAGVVVHTGDSIHGYQLTRGQVV